MVVLYVFPINIDIKFIDIIGIDLPKPIHDKALRFLKTSDQNNYLAARWLLYKLAQKDGIQHSLGDFTIGKNGKPYIPGFPSFNISHCNGLVVLAMFENSIGVDVENIDTKFQLDAFRDVFSPKEIADIENHGAKAFFYYWTIKEAVLKCTGEGMAKLSTLQQINIKNENVVVHNNNHLYFNSFTFNDSFVISYVTSFQDGNFGTFNFFKCGIDSNSELVIEESIDNLNPICTLN
jgi:phosphopantetheinyl transferase